MKSAAMHILWVLLLSTILQFTFSQEVKDVGMEPISEKTNTFYDFLTKLDNALLKNTKVVSPKLYLLSPEEQRFLEYRRLSEIKGNADIYEMVLPFLIAKQGASMQSKTKKNSEITRGIYNSLNYRDLFNAGKRGYH